MPTPPRHPCEFFRKTPLTHRLPSRACLPSPYDSLLPSRARLSWPYGPFSPSPARLSLPYRTLVHLTLKVTVAAFTSAGLKVLGRSCIRNGGTAAAQACVFDLVCGAARRVDTVGVFVWYLCAAASEDGSKLNTYFTRITRYNLSQCGASNAVQPVMRCNLS